MARVKAISATSAALVFSMFTSVFLARALGPKLFGMYSLIIAYSGLLQKFSSLGSNLLLSTKLSRNELSNDEFVEGCYISFFGGCVGFAFTSLLVYVCLGSVELENRPIIAVIASIPYLFGVSEYFSSLLSAGGFYSRSQYPPLLETMLKFLASLACFLLGLKLAFLFIAFAGASMIRFVYAIHIFSISLRVYSVDLNGIALVSLARLRNVVQTSFPLLIGLFLFSLLSRLPILLGSTVMSSAEIGGLSISLSILYAVYSLVDHDIVSDQKVSMSLSSWQFKKLQQRRFAKAVLASVFLSAIAPFFFSFIYGHRYVSPSLTFFAGLCVALIGLAMSSINGQQLRWDGAEHFAYARFALAIAMLAFMWCIILALRWPVTVGSILFAYGMSIILSTLICASAQKRLRSDESHGV